MFRTLRSFIHQLFSLYTANVSRGRIESEIERASCFLEGHAPHRVRVYHRGFDVAVSEKLLDGSDVEVRLEQMAREAVAKRVGGGALADPGLPDRPLDGLLHLRFMEIIPPKLTSRRDAGQLHGRKKPLPDEILCCVRIFFFQPIDEEDTCIAPIQILLVKRFE